MCVCMYVYVCIINSMIDITIYNRRMLQFTKEKSKKVKALEEKLDKKFVEHFSQLVTEVYKQPNSVIVSQGKNY